jgi:hypothetical protein
MLPVKKGQSNEDRARAIEGALDWIRDRRVGFIIDEPLGSLDQVGTVSVSQRSPEGRKNDLDAAIHWIRNGKKSFDDLTGNFKKVDQMIPEKINQSPEDRAREIENVLDWMRSRDISPSRDDASDMFQKIGTVPMSRRTPEQRQKDANDSLNWLRNKGANDDVLDPTGEFRKMDGVLPSKRGQSLEDRARDIEGALDWAR